MKSVRQGDNNYWRENILARKSQLQLTNRFLSIASEINEVRLSRLLTGRESPKRRDTIATTLLRICSILGFSVQETHKILLDASKGVIHPSELPATSEELGIKMGSYQAQRLIELLQEGELSIVEMLLKNYNFSSLVGESFRVFLGLSAGVYKDQILEKLFYIAERITYKTIHERDFNQKIANILQFCFHYLVSCGGGGWKESVTELLSKLSRNIFGHFNVVNIADANFLFIIRGEKVAEELIKSGDPSFLPYLISSNRHFLKSNIFSQQKYLGNDASVVEELIKQIVGISFAGLSPYALATLNSFFAQNPISTTEKIKEYFQRQSLQDSVASMIKHDEFQKFVEQNLRTNYYFSKQWVLLSSKLRSLFERTTLH